MILFYCFATDVWRIEIFKMLLPLSKSKNVEKYRQYA